MNEPIFKLGDVVTMKMGGPRMTVERIHPHRPTIIHCVWFDQNESLHRDAFDDFALEAVTL